MVWIKTACCLDTLNDSEENEQMLIRVQSQLNFKLQFHSNKPRCALKILQQNQSHCTHTASQSGAKLKQSSAQALVHPQRPTQTPKLSHQWGGGRHVHVNYLNTSLTKDFSQSLQKEPGLRHGGWYISPRDPWAYLQWSHPSAPGQLPVHD